MSRFDCPVCRGPMKPLFRGYFCPRDCDRRPLEQFERLLMCLPPRVAEVIRTGDEWKERPLSVGWSDRDQMTHLNAKREFPLDELLTQDWSARVTVTDQVLVIKNRWGELSVDQLPIYKEKT